MQREAQGAEFSVSEVFVSSHGKLAHVMIRGLVSPPQISADDTEESGCIGSESYSITFTKDGKAVARFSGESVQGWWIS